MLCDDCYIKIVLSRCFDTQYANELVNKSFRDRRTHCAILHRPSRRMTNYLYKSSWPQASYVCLPFRSFSDVTRPIKKSMMLNVMEIAGPDYINSPWALHNAQVRLCDCGRQRPS